LDATYSSRPASSVASVDYTRDELLMMKHRGVIIDDPTVGGIGGIGNNNRRGGKSRPPYLLLFTIFLLLCEMGTGMLAVMFYQDLPECCGDSFVSENDSVTASWNSAIFAIGIGYLTWVIITIPIVIISKEPVFLFNAMIGYLLAIQMLYVSNILYAYIMYGLETFAVLGQAVVLCILNRNAELCIHSLFNFTMCGLVTYLFIELSRQGGYCVVGGQLEGVFVDPTCVMNCDNIETCSFCDGEATSCFFAFPPLPFFS
jgi:hypothetical protein